MTTASLPVAQPFMLDANPGQRFCLYHAPASRPRGAILYVHPFAEEMNKTRRLAAQQSRAFAASGYGVLQTDLYGCGDSSGDSGDASCAIWLSDLALACAWLNEHCPGPQIFWGLRLGALLALAYACSLAQASEAPTPAALIFWQPALHGRSHLAQFLRMRQTARMLAGATGDIGSMRAAPGIGTAADDPGLEHGSKAIEVGGYRLSPALLRELTALEAGRLRPPCPVHWLHVGAAQGSPDSGAPTAARQAGDNAAPGRCNPGLPAPVHLQLERWRSDGVAVHMKALQGAPFWAGTDIADCPALLAATSALELP
ncbi:hydrolase 2, exosortase A system-associated [Oxalobacteraceae bacterium]|nr:hydrolase 2, exosortase A system-associated [Oxalobacteraceae bacterium]